jgi:hypothetical protein
VELGNLDMMLIDVIKFTIHLAEIINPRNFWEKG